MLGSIKQLAVCLLLLVDSSRLIADSERIAIPPFCKNAYKLIDASQTGRIRIEDGSARELFILRSLGVDGMQIVEQAVKLPPFQKIQSEAEALALLEMVADNPQVYEPINHVLNRLTPGNSWALYLNSGFHAVSTHTDGHRDMVQEAIDSFPVARPGDAHSVLDMGIGNGNLLIAAAIRDPYARVEGVDIASAGLNISMLRMNEVADLASQKYSDPALDQVGRFWMGRGSATDPHLLTPGKYKAASMVLTLFAVPPSQRKAALENIYRSLEPGARFVLIDPLPEAAEPAKGRQFLKDIITNSYRNNPDLTVLDVVMLVAKNAHSIFKIPFLSAAEQRALGENVGFKAIGPSQTAFYGRANITIFEKPF